jgi:uncharacterized DUF497 family protein
VLGVGKTFEYQFEWDPVKAQQNIKEHRISFERAAIVFLDPNSLSRVDDEHSEDERWITLGLDRAGVVLVVCHTFRDETESAALIRLISARGANRSEVKQYGEK